MKKKRQPTMSTRQLCSDADFRAMCRDVGGDPTSTRVVDEFPGGPPSPCDDIAVLKMYGHEFAFVFLVHTDTGERDLLLRPVSRSYDDLFEMAIECCANGIELPPRLRMDPIKNGHVFDLIVQRVDGVKPWGCTMRFEPVEPTPSSDAPV